MSKGKHRVSIQKHVTLAVVIAVAAISLVGAELLKRPDACVVGDIRAREQATVPDALRDSLLDARRVRVGFGTAAIGGWDSLGDALATAGELWLRPTDRNSADYYGLTSSRFFRASAFIFVPREHTPRTRLRLAKGATVGEIWRNLAGRYPSGVIAAGYARAQVLNGIAIAAPAIHAMPISKYAPQYYTMPMESALDSWIYVVAVAVDPQRPALSIGGPLLSRVIPSQMRQTHARYGYAHFLRLKNEPSTTLLPPKGANVASVGQLLDSTTVSDGELELYPLTRLSGCDELFASTPPPDAN